MAHMITLDYVKRDGSTKREHYQMIEKISGKKQEILVVKEINPNSKYLIDTFFRVSSTRGISANGQMLPISYLEMNTYFSMMKIEMEPWEIELLKELDFVYMDSIIQERNEDKEA